MVVFKHKVSGGHLAMPEYGVAFECAHNTAMMFDGQEILHGVTPIKKEGESSLRYSIVYYSLQQIWNCLPLTEEIARLRNKKYQVAQSRLSDIQKRKAMDAELADDMGAELKRLMADSSVEAVILESAFVDNLPVVLNILKQGYHIQALYLKVTDATRGVRRNSKSPDQPASLTKKQSVSQSEAARLFIKLKDMAETHSVIRAGAINAEQEPEAVYAAAQRFIAAGERN
jgi:hypothetical protein